MNDTGDEQQDARGAPTGAAPAENASTRSIVTSMPPPPRTLAAPVAWLALLLVLAVAGAGFYLFLDLQRREAALLARVQGLEATTGQDTTTFDQLRDNLTRRIELELEGIAARQARAEEDQQRAVARLETLLGEVTAQTRREVSDAVATTVKESITERVAPVEDTLRELQRVIGEFGAQDRESWRLAEVQYLLRLANERLVLADDTTTAIALAERADAVLAELGSGRVSALRETLSTDLAALRTAPDIDVGGLYLRLEALTQRVEELVLYEVPRSALQAEDAPPTGWRARLSAGFQSALEKLSNYIVVSRRDVTVESLMDPQYEALVRQNLRMLLEQAQIAVLAHEELPYRHSLERAEAWVSQYFGTGGDTARAMAVELRALGEARVSAETPTLAASLEAMEAVMRARLAAGDG